MYKGIIIGFSYGSSWISKVIKWITRGKCSHCWISYWSETLQQRLIVHADLPGVLIEPFDKWARQNGIIKMFKIQNENVEKTKKSLVWLTDQVSKKYDFTAMCLAGIAMWLRRYIKGRFSNPSKLICSELVLKFCTTYGFSAFDVFDPELSNPNLILPAFEAETNLNEISQEEL